ncbi:MAG: hypothetical protein REI78_04255 [Pedobacter sp.]|nr:hypothetical protein [Pedobacter sp.]
MKNRIRIAFLAFGLLFGCNSEADYKVTRQEVMDLHDKLMIDGEIAIRNKMRLDTLGKQGLKKLKSTLIELDTLLEKQQIDRLIAMLNGADDQMMDWMHNFQADVEGKSNAQAVAYFQGEKVKLYKLDSIYRTALAQSDEYLKRFKLNVPQTHGDHHH